MKPRLFARFHKNPFVNFLYNEKLNRILTLLPSCREDTVILDLGCSSGYFTRALPAETQKVGMDVERSKILQAQERYGSLANFVLGDINFLPFREESVDIIICASVLEHLRELKHALNGMEHTLKKGGMLITGYPITNSLMKTSIRILAPYDYRCIDPRIWGQKYFDERPTSHKQNYKRIREKLRGSLVLIEMDKIPVKWFPDFLSIYECVKMARVSGRTSSTSSKRTKLKKTIVGRD